MERVRITELILSQREKTGKKATHQEVGDFVFKGEKGRRKGGKPQPITPLRRSRLIGRWDNGLDLTAMKPRHLLRLSKFFNVTDINQLLSE